MKKTILLLLLLILNNSNIFSQSKKPTLFFNCSKECYQDFLKTELSYFDFVRDRFEADIQILIIEQEQNNGGKKLTINFIGNKQWAQVNDTSVVNVQASDTPTIIREQLLKTINSLLLSNFPKSLIAADIEINFPKRNTDSIDVIKDKWNFWVISPGIDGWAEGGNLNLFANMNADFTIRRVTNNSKFIVKPYYNKLVSFYKLDSTKLKGGTTAYGTNLLYAKSINQHWSAGFIAQYGYDSYTNIQSFLKIAPVIEYNIFPFSINTSKQARIAYQVGINSFKYIDTTIYDLTNEVRPYQRITLSLEYNKQWGSVITSVFYNSYLDKMQKNRLGLSALFALRLFEGVALTLDGEAYYINDQISLLKNNLSDTDYLLGTQQLPADFSYELNFGLRFTFGSIYNNIVNPRFNNIE